MPHSPENELLDPKIEKSPTCSKFEIDFKFWNLASNFETHKNIGDNFDYMYKYMYIWSIYPNGINEIEGQFWYQKRTLTPKKIKVLYLL